MIFLNRNCQQKFSFDSSRNVKAKYLKQFSFIDIASDHSKDHIVFNRNLFKSHKNCIRLNNEILTLLDKQPHLRTKEESKKVPPLNLNSFILFNFFKVGNSSKTISQVCKLSTNYKGKVGSSCYLRKVMTYFTSPVGGVGAGDLWPHFHDLSSFF